MGLVILVNTNIRGTIKQKKTAECEAFENWITKNTEELEITKPTEEMLLLSCHLKRDKSKEN